MTNKLLLNDDKFKSTKLIFIFCVVSKSRMIYILNENKKF